MISPHRTVRQFKAKIVRQETIASNTVRLTIHCPEIASSYAPGQFVMIRIANQNDPLIARALAVYDRQDLREGEWQELDLVYVVKGKFTTQLAKLLPQQEVSLWGPLGNAFSCQPVDHLIMVAGGVGETPMLSLGKEALGLSHYRADRSPGFAKRVVLCYGARTASLLAGIDDFERCGIEVRVSTDDGSKGSQQLVTATLEQVLAECEGSVRIACCGPEPMMEAVAAIAIARGVECEISLETPMACGIGICFTCVAKIREEQSLGAAASEETCSSDGSPWDYRRTCVEGPIFKASQIVWH